MDIKAYDHFVVESRSRTQYVFAFSLVRLNAILEDWWIVSFVTKALAKYNLLRSEWIGSDIWSRAYARVLNVVDTFPCPAVFRSIAFTKFLIIDQFSNMNIQFIAYL